MSAEQKMPTKSRILEVAIAESQTHRNRLEGWDYNDGGTYGDGYGDDSYGDQSYGEGPAG